MNNKINVLSSVKLDIEDLYFTKLKKKLIFNFQLTQKKKLCKKLKMHKFILHLQQ